MWAFENVADEPDAFLGFILPGITMGQILSLPMILAGMFLILRARPLSLGLSPSPSGRGPG